MVLIILFKKNKCSISDVYSITPSIFKVNKKKNKCLKNKKDAVSQSLQHLKDDKLFEILIDFIIYIAWKDMYCRYQVSIRRLCCYICKRRIDKLS